ncbi:MAG: endonuclease/exonuclease/phosphatase family protein [Pseudomonadales bacterium]|nr:endonuclease/exonuclease/phosphatase family protein [Pseudomonadales bacterium]
MLLLSWNIQWGRGLDGRVDLARITDTIRAMGDFDVICLQEVARNFPGLPGSAGEDQMALLAAGLPDHAPVYAVATDLPDGRGGRKQFGNALFSRLPVGQVFRHQLAWPADSSVPSMQRVLLEAVVAAPWGPVRVMTTHLEYYSPAIRAAQVACIRSYHAQACAHAQAPRQGKGEGGGPFEVLPRPASALLCGDMNFPEASPERLLFLAEFDDGTPAWRDSWEVLHRGEPHAPTVGIHPVDFVDRPSCYDFVFLTEDLAPRLIGHGVNAETTASDHQPVWVELKD